jgi:polar amino acid transport system substrate-binding protein
MRIPTRFLAAASLAAASFLAGAAMAADSIVFGTDATYPPFESLDAGGKFLGFDIDVANALCAKMNVKCTFVNQDFDGIIPALQAKKFDAIISSMSITPDRMKKIDFTDKIYNTPPAIAVPKDSTIKEATNAGLAGKTLGAQSSTTHANYAGVHMKDAQLKLYPSPDEYKLDMSSGRIDAVIDDVVVLDEWTKTDSGSCCKVLGTLPIDKDINGVGAGIGVRKGDDDLRKKFNDAIAAIRADGTYKKIQDKYFTFDVYGE